MAMDTLKGNWKKLKGKIKEKWGKLTDDDIEVIAGKRDQLIDKLQKLYGLSREEADRRVDDFYRRAARHSGLKMSGKVSHTCRSLQREVMPVFTPLYPVHLLISKNKMS